MSLFERTGLALLRPLDPETAHSLALKALALGLGPRGGAVTSPRLACSLAGIALPNPIGIAAGFDKNAEALPALFAAGPGFVEIGGVTPKPQPGNPRPRLFRLAEERAVINRFGFNNDGMVAVRPRLERARGLGVVGINLGANKTSEDRAGDYAQVLDHLYDVADFFTVNVSSPNTERLRDLQGREALTAVLERVLSARARQSTSKPLLVKIAPDLDEAGLDAVAEVALALGLDGIIATNTTIARAGLAGRHAQEAGGLSGQPLFTRSTEVLSGLKARTAGRLTLVGVGGIATPEQALAKLDAGAGAVQLYTALAFEGLSLVRRLAQDLDALLADR
ncbi:MAG: quinone-dependent dihydroorotate dehydrogenase [Pseudomonadota bacterium]